MIRHQQRGWLAARYSYIIGALGEALASGFLAGFLIGFWDVVLNRDLDHGTLYLAALRVLPGVLAGIGTFSAAAIGLAALHRLPAPWNKKAQ